MRQLLLSLLIVLPLAVSAQTVNLDNVEARRSVLQAELETEERAIAENIKLLEAKQKDVASVKGEVDILKAQIAKAENNIKAKKLEIARLGDDIRTREKRIDDLDSRIDREQESLAELLRQTREVDSASLPEIVLASQDFSDFFRDIDQFELVEKEIHRSFLGLRQAQAEALVEKKALEDRQNKELDAKKTIEYQQKVIEQQEKEKKNILSLHQKAAATYQDIIAWRGERAGAIRSALFALRDTAPIPFGKALEFALKAKAKTGVRPAFLLAVLQQESNLGENIGTCNRPGDPPEKSWRQVMKPARDHAPYLRLTSALGLNPDTMPVSCPWQGGYGGALGPAQFLPSTWELYQSTLADLLGRAPANPWQPEDAFMAAANYLAERGAASGSYSAEREAALRYYAGANWKKARNAFYGNEVMARAESIQLNMINPLQNV